MSVRRVDGPDPAMDTQNLKDLIFLCVFVLAAIGVFVWWLKRNA